MHDTIREARMTAPLGVPSFIGRSSRFSHTPQTILDTSPVTQVLSDITSYLGPLPLPLLRWSRGPPGIKDLFPPEALQALPHAEDYKGYLVDVIHVFSYTSNIFSQTIQVFSYTSDILSQTIQVFSYTSNIFSGTKIRKGEKVYTIQFGRIWIFLGSIDGN